MCSNNADSYQYVLTLTIQHVVEALAAQQVHELPLLVRPHARECHTVQHDSLNQGLIRLLQQVLKGWPCYAALHCALQAHKSYVSVL